MNKITELMKQANYFMFMVLVAALPLPRTIMTWCWALWCITWLLECRFRDSANIQWGKRMIPCLFLFGWVLWECVSFLCVKRMGEGGYFPNVHISLLFFPIIYLYGLNAYYDWKKIAKVFIIGCVCSFFVYCWLLYWVTNYRMVLFTQGNGPEIPFQLHYFDDFFSAVKHRMLYCSALGVAIILLFMLRKDMIAQWGKVKAYCLFLVSLSVMITAILVTGSRANLFALVVLGAIAGISQIKKYRAVITTAIIVACIGCCLTIWKVHPRMKDLKIEQLTHIEEHVHDPNMQPRVTIWYLALQHPEDYLAHGLGMGNIEEYMLEKYTEQHLDFFKAERYAAHNQYLSVCMELGLVAMLLFIFFWYYIPFCYPKNSQARQFALYFILFFGINMFTDDNLSRLEPVIYTCVCLLIMDLMAKAEIDKPCLEPKNDKA